MHVMRNRAEVVEELAEQVPPFLTLHHVGADQQIARFFDGLFQQKSLAVADTNIAEPFVGRSAGPIVSVGG
jgi:hypothetical protein